MRIQVYSSPLPQAGSLYCSPDGLKSLSRRLLVLQVLHAPHPELYTVPHCSRVVVPDSVCNQRRACRFEEERVHRQILRLSLALPEYVFWFRTDLCNGPALPDFCDIGDYRLCGGDDMLAGRCDVLVVLRYPR